MPYPTAEPLDRKLIFRQRPWVFWFGVGLAFNAGFVNAVLLGFSHVPVSHLTGTMSRMSIDVVQGNQQDLRLIGSVILGFLGGCVSSGMLIGTTSLQPGRRYGVALILVGVLLGLSALALDTPASSLGIGLAAMACGLQNALYSSYHGLILRTTHLTGIITDIGVLLGQWIRHGRLQSWKIGVLLGTVLSFVTGGSVGAYALMRLDRQALLPSALASGMGGLAYVINKWRWQQPEEQQ